MDRRSFLKGIFALAAGAAIEKAIPFNRVWSFPSVVKPLNTWDDITALTDGYIVPTMFDDVLMESTTRGGAGRFYEEYMRRVACQVHDEAFKSVVLYGEGRSAISWFKNSVSPEPSIALCPTSEILPVEIETELVRGVSKSGLSSLREDLALPERTLREVVRDVVSPIESIVRSLRHSVEDARDAVFPT